MRLLVLTSSYPTTVNPGGGIFIRRMVEHLPDDMNIKVLTPDTQLSEPLKYNCDNIKLKCYRYAPRKMQILANQFGGIPSALQARPVVSLLLPSWAAAMFGHALILARNSDLIHAHWSVAGLIGGLAGWLTNTPVVTTLHGTDVAWAERHWSMMYGLTAAIRLSRRIVTVSSAMNQSLKFRFSNDAQKFEMVANGVGPEFWRIYQRQSHTRSGRFTIAVIGSLVGSKQVEHVVHAFKRLIDSGRSARLKIAGQGPAASRLVSMARRLDLHDHIEFCGVLAPQHIADLMQKSQVLVLASAREGRPTVVMEAMAAGLPVIASCIDGVKELIEHDRRGLLFQSGDVRQLYEHMKTVFDRPKQARALAAQARSWIEEQNLTWQHTAECYARIYDQVIRNRKGI